MTLDSAIAASPFRIAPERQLELRNWCDKEKVNLSYLGNTGFRIDVDTSSKEICVSLKSIEFIWCSCYSHLVLYSEYQSELDKNRNEFDIIGNICRKNALALFDWASLNLKQDANVPWPEELPQPEQCPNQASLMFKVNEMFLAAMGWILHHELAHIRLGHINTALSNSIMEEKDADVTATKWILDQCKIGPEMNKRCIGIAAAILALLGMEIPARKSLPLTHPRAYERIYYCLEEARLNENAHLYRYIAIIIQLQLSTIGHFPEVKFGTHQELYYAYLEIISRT